MTEATNTNNSDLLTWACAILLQWRVDRDASAEHRGHFLRRYLLGNGDDEMRRHSGVVGISTIRFTYTIWVFRVVGAHHVLAMLFGTIGTLSTVWLQARRALSANTDAVANPEDEGSQLTIQRSPKDGGKVMEYSLDATLNLASDLDGGTDDLVADHTRVVCWLPSRTESVQI